MKLILHIGTEKTGSSSIQALLNQNREQLMSCGYYFPSTLGEKNNRLVPAYCLRSVRTDEFFEERFINTPEKRSVFNSDFIDLFDAEISALPDSIHTVIISSEHFHSRLMYDDELILLKNLTDPYFQSVKVLVYLRKQVDVVISSYSTAIKAGKVFDFSTYISERCTPNDFFFDYQSLLSLWKRVFGGDAIIPRLYEEAYLFNGRLIDDFFNQIDPSLLSIIENSSVSENPSLSPLGISLLKSINAVIPRFEEGLGISRLNSKLQEIIAANFIGSGPSLPESEYARIQSSFDNINEAVRKEYFPSRAALFGSSGPATCADNLSSNHDIALEKIFSTIKNNGGSPIPNSYADVLRDSAIVLEEIDIDKAYHLMQLAALIRPDGPFIRNKLEEYRKRLGS